MLVEKQEGKTFNGVHTPSCTLKWGFPRDRPAGSGILARACWSAAFKGKEPVFFTGLAADLLGLQRIYVCTVLWRETCHISNFRIRGNGKLMEKIQKEGLQSWKLWRRCRGEGDNRVNMEIDLWTPLAPAAAMSPPAYTALTVASIWEGIEASVVFIPRKKLWSFQQKLKLVHLEDWCEPVVLVERPDHTHQKRLLLLPPVSCITLNNLIHSSLSSWAVIDLSVI